MTTEHDRLATLLDERDIEKLLLRYCRGIDRVDVELLRAVFLPDAHLEYSMFVGPARDFCTLVPEFVKGMGLTQHRLSNVLVEVNGDCAHGESYAVAHHADVPVDGALVDVRVGVRYADRFERRDGAWRIARRRVIYDWKQVMPSGGGWEPPLFTGEMIFGQRGRGDASYATD